MEKPRKAEEMLKLFIVSSLINTLLVLNRALKRFNDDVFVLKKGGQIWFSRAKKEDSQTDLFRTSFFGHSLIKISTTSSGFLTLTYSYV